MPKIKFYDWSSLDRDSIIKTIGSVRKDMVKKQLRGSKVTKIIRSCIRGAGIPINVKSVYDQPSSSSPMLWVGGSYESYKDRKNLKSITMTLHYNSKKSPLYFDYSRFRRLSRNVADTILHEIIHARQYRRRKYKDIPGYESVAESSKQRLEQEYLGHNDEIDAYAFNIACELKDIHKKNNKEIFKYINSNLSDERHKKTLYRMYLKAFDFNHNHKIIKKLKKRITYYLPYVELGKPYKTADWLK